MEPDLLWGINLDDYLGYFVHGDNLFWRHVGSFANQSEGDPVQRALENDSDSSLRNSAAHIAACDEKYV
ncbi:hypothetical protein D3C73_1437330 [compost metagenome]